MHEPALVRLRERFAHLEQDVNDARRRQRTVLLHQRLEIEPVEHFHHEIEGLVVRHPEVVYLHAVRRPETGSGLRLSAEPLDGEARGVVPRVTEHLGTDELDRGGTRQHAVRRAVHLAHPSAADQLAQLVAPELARPGHLTPQPRHHTGDHDRDADDQVVRVVHQEGVCGGAEVPHSLASRDEHRHRIHRHRDERRHQHLAGGRRQNRRECQHHGADPAHLGADDGAGRQTSRDRDREMEHEADRERHQDHVDEPDVEDHRRIAATPARVEEERDRCHDAA